MTNKPRWRPIETARQDGTKIWVYAAEYEGLPAFQTECRYHPDAGWCVDELRHVTHWVPMEEVWLPSPTCKDSLQAQADDTWVWRRPDGTPFTGFAEPEGDLVIDLKKHPIPFEPDLDKPFEPDLDKWDQD